MKKISLTLLLATLSVGITGLHCSGGLGGGGAGTLDSNMAGGPLPSPLSPRGNFTSGAIQAGGEGDGQEDRKSKFVVSAELPTQNGDHTNCGLPENQVPFPEGNDSPQLTATFAPSDHPNLFVNPVTNSLGPRGRAKLAFPTLKGIPIEPPCPLFVPSVNTGRVILSPFSPKTTRLLVTYFDKQTKTTYHAQTDLACNAECENPPCEICLVLKPGEPEPIASSPTDPTSPVNFTPPSVAGQTDEEANTVKNPNLRLRNNQLNQNIFDLLDSISSQSNP